MKKEYIIPCMSFVYSAPIGNLLGIKNEELEKLYAVAIYWFQKKKFESNFRNLISNTFDGVIDGYYEPFVDKFNSLENAKKIGFQFSNYLKKNYV